MISTQLFNVLLMSFSFLLIHLSLGTLSAIQKVIVNSINSQYISITFVAYSIGNLIVPSIQRLISTEKCLFLPSIIQSFCFFVFLYPIRYLLTVQSIILGFCTSLLWTSQFTYLSENSTPETIDRNSGILWSIYQSGLIIGSFYFYLQYQGVKVIQDQDRIHTYGFFITILFVGAFLFLFLRKNPVTNTDLSTKNQPVFKKCLTIMKKKEMLIFSIACIFVGLLQAFLMSIYPTVIAFTKSFAEDSVKLIGLCGIFTGIGEILAGQFFVWFGKSTRKNRFIICFIGFVVCQMTFLLIFLNHPLHATHKETKDFGILKPRIWIAMLCSFFLGTLDCCFNVQNIAYIGEIFPDSEDTGCSFAMNRFLQSIGSSFFYLLSSFNASLSIQLPILVASAIFNMFSYYFLEQIIAKKTTKNTVFEIHTLSQNVANERQMISQ